MLRVHACNIEYSCLKSKKTKCIKFTIFRIFKFRSFVNSGAVLPTRESAACEETTFPQLCSRRHCVVRTQNLQFAHVGSVWRRNMYYDGFEQFRVWESKQHSQCWSHLCRKVVKSCFFARCTLRVRRCCPHSTSTAHELRNLKIKNMVNLIHLDFLLLAFYKEAVSDVTCMHS